jgi:predicted amidophosphoribosyltransferase
MRCFEPKAPGLTEDENVCATCRALPLSTDLQRFVWEYRELARDFIKAMKYRPSKKLARLAGNLLAHTLPNLFEEQRWDIVIPVPSSVKTFRKRCFHPCVEMGHQVAQALRVPLKLVLSSNPKRDPQAKLHHDARLKGIRQLFTIRGPKHIHSKRVLLIEDVITTGATVSAAARCLKAAGATSVDVLALARTQAWQRFRHRVWVAGT